MTTPIVATQGVQSIAFCGFAMISGLLTDDEATHLAASIDDLRGLDPEQRRGGTRSLLALNAVRTLACSQSVISLVECSLGVGAFPVRGLLFDKTAEANWLAPWHQDLTICVRERRDVPGYGPWSRKTGVDHVQPPVAAPEQMLAVRIRLKDYDDTNGALRVLPGTHKRGRMSAPEIAEAAATIEAQCCPVPHGGAMLMKPLLLHSSPPAANPSHRRVLHIDYANCALDGGLEWLRG